MVALEALLLIQKPIARRAQLDAVLGEKGSKLSSGVGSVCTREPRRLVMVKRR